MRVKVKQMSDQIRSKMYISSTLPPKFHVSLNLDIVPFSIKEKINFLRILPNCQSSHNQINTLKDDF